MSTVVCGVFCVMKREWFNREMGKSDRGWEDDFFSSQPRRGKYLLALFVYSLLAIIKT